MGLTRVIPIREVVVKSDQLGELMQLISAICPKRDDAASVGETFELTIHRDKFTTESLDTVQENYASLLDTPLKELKLSVRDCSKNRSIKLELSHGESGLNRITIKGDDENWVEEYYRKLDKVISKFPRQGRFFHKWEWPLGLGAAVPIGYVIMVRVVVPFNKMAFIGSDNSGQRATVFGVLLTAMLTGGIPAMLLIWKIKSLFPSVELQIGPEHTWQEASQRKIWAFIGTLAVLGPLGDMIISLWNFALGR